MKPPPAAATVQEEAFAGKKKKYEQYLKQMIVENGKPPLNGYCQNLAAQIQVDGNAMNILGVQGMA